MNRLSIETFEKMTYSDRAICLEQEIHHVKQSVKSESECWDEDIINLEFEKLRKMTEIHRKLTEDYIRKQTQLDLFGADVFRAERVLENGRS